MSGRELPVPIAPKLPAGSETQASLSDRSPIWRCSEPDGRLCRSARLRKRHQDQGPGCRRRRISNPECRRLVPLQSIFETYTSHFHATRPNPDRNTLSAISDHTIHWRLGGTPRTIATAILTSGRHHLKRCNTARLTYANLCISQRNPNTNATYLWQAIFGPKLITFSFLHFRSARQHAFAPSRPRASV